MGPDILSQSATISAISVFCMHSIMAVYSMAPYNIYPLSVSCNGCNNSDYSDYAPLYFEGKE